MSTTMAFSSIEVPITLNCPSSAVVASNVN
jgi:hypothetical protein